MNLEFLILGGYWYFVWPAFVFTFVSCFVLYFKTNKEFKAQKRIFLNEFKQMQSVKTRTFERKESLSSSLIS